MNKKVLITILITITLLIFSIILYPVIKNNNYQKKLLNNIYENTNLKDIKYLNKDNNYYIIKTKDSNFYVMEINSGVMMQNFIKQNENGYMIAKLIYKEAIIEMFNN